MTTEEVEKISCFTLDSTFKPEEVEELDKYLQLRNRGRSSTIPPTNAHFSLVEVKEEREQGGAGTDDPKPRPFVARLTVKIEGCLTLEDLSNATDSLSYRVDGHDFRFPYKYAGLKITRDEKGRYVCFISFSRQTSNQ